MKAFTAKSVSRVLIIFVSLMFFAATTSFARPGLPDFTKMVEKYGPAVVNISTVQKLKSKSMDHFKRRMPDLPQDGPFGDWFKKFFDDDGRGGFNGEERKAESLGSGFVISADGYILTNNHVVDGADKIIVRLSDRRELDAELIGRDERSDLALLKIDAPDLQVVRMGSSEKLKPGEWVLAIGSPFGFDYSVTAGIVSAKGRSLPKENYVPFIQTDVAINPGNSGGPLFNLDGEVIGINSQIYSRTGGYMGVSFAIPIDVAMNVVEQLKKDGHVVRGWLGVLIQDVTRDLAESFNMDKPHGALVARVLPDSPAEDAGFQVGDVVVNFNGKYVDHSSDLPPIVGITPIDKKVPVEIIRKGKAETISVVIGELPKEDNIKVSSRSDGAVTVSRVGLVVSKISDEQRERLELSTNVGVVVKEVKSGAGAKSGIRRGDIILMVNNTDVKDAKHFKAIIDDLPANKSVPVLVHRQGSPIFLAMKVED
ncbi:MAG TPA: DegQ family serine endoprotease [Gammaproteobacteria bacterium]|nr:DegQ family serine endoprotease [Gammaproteobacteria bacterium]